MNDDEKTTLSDLLGFEPWLVGIVGFALWVFVAAIAYLVAPRDRPGHFFWCTLFLLGPLGIVLALVAPARPEATP